MSESGEMSEFGYIMELLAKGKVSVSAVGLCLCWRSPLGTQDLRVGCGIGVVPRWGHTSRNRVCALHWRIPAVHNAPWPPFLYVEERGLTELVGGVVREPGRRERMETKRLPCRRARRFGMGDGRGT